MLVGPRHAVTSSRCAVWGNLRGKSQPITRMVFQPGYHHGQEVFPSMKVDQCFWSVKTSRSRANNLNNGAAGGDVMV